MFYKDFSFSSKERKSLQKCKNSQLKLYCLGKAANRLEITCFFRMILFLTGVDVKGHTEALKLASEVTESWWN